MYSFPLICSGKGFYIGCIVSAALRIQQVAGSHVSFTSGEGHDSSQTPHRTYHHLGAAGFYKAGKSFYPWIVGALVESAFLPVNLFDHPYLKRTAFWMFQGIFGKKGKTVGLGYRPHGAGT